MKLIILGLMLSGSIFAKNMTCWQMGINQNIDNVLFAYNAEEAFVRFEYGDSSALEEAILLKEDCLTAGQLKSICKFEIKSSVDYGGWEYEMTTLSGSVKLKKMLGADAALYLGYAHVKQEGYHNMIGFGSSEEKVEIACQY